MASVRRASPRRRGTSPRTLLASQQTPRFPQRIPAARPLAPPRPALRPRPAWLAPPRLAGPARLAPPRPRSARAALGDDTFSPACTSLPGRFLRGALWVAGRVRATVMAGDVGGRRCPDSELLLHPELLSREFLLLTLEQVGAGAAGAGAGVLWRARSRRLGGSALAHLVSPRPPEGDVLAHQEPLGVGTYRLGFLMARKEGSSATLAACTGARKRVRARVVGGRKRGRGRGLGSTARAPRLQTRTQG